MFSWLFPAKLKNVKKSNSLYKIEPNKNCVDTIIKSSNDEHELCYTQSYKSNDNR